MSADIIRRMIKSKLSRYSDINTILPQNIQQNILDIVITEELDNFANRSYKLLSPNIYLESLVFEMVFNYLYKHHKDSVIFENDTTLDIKTMVAASQSLIQRPNIRKPSEVIQGFTEPSCENDYVVISRFERELAFENSSDKGGIVFEGLLPGKIEINPLANMFCSHHIWTNSFYINKPFVQGIHTNINSIESSSILWMNSGLLAMLDLKLDDYKNGLKALNNENEIILQFRCWRDKLIDKGSYFIGTHSNIAKLEGCDLILRKDYFDRLKEMIPSLVFYCYVTSH